MSTEEKMRANLALKLKELFQKDDRLSQSLIFPEIPNGRLRTIVNQGYAQKN